MSGRHCTLPMALNEIRNELTQAQNKHEHNICQLPERTAAIAAIKALPNVGRCTFVSALLCCSRVWWGLMGTFDVVRALEAVLMLFTKWGMCYRGSAHALH